MRPPPFSWAATQVRLSPLTVSVETWLKVFRQLPSLFPRLLRASSVMLYPERVLVITRWFSFPHDPSSRNVPTFVREARHRPPLAGQFALSRRPELRFFEHLLSVRPGWIKGPSPPLSPLAHVALMTDKGR